MKIFIFFLLIFPALVLGESTISKRSLSKCEAFYLESVCEGQLISVDSGRSQPIQDWTHSQKRTSILDDYICSSSVRRITIVRCGKCKSYKLINEYDLIS